MGLPTGKTVIEMNKHVELSVLVEEGLQARDENILVVFIGQPTGRPDPDEFAGAFVHEFDHRGLPSGLFRYGLMYQSADNAPRRAMTHVKRRFRAYPAFFFPRLRRIWE
jgi:hypothetical protein